MVLDTDSLNWSEQTELVGLSFTLAPQSSVSLYPQYATGLHAWFLDQVRQDNPSLSAKLHDQAEEKAFTTSRLEGNSTLVGKQLQLWENQSYYWSITALSKEVSSWIRQWMQHCPNKINLRHVCFNIQAVEINLPSKTYSQLSKVKKQRSLTLSFLSPTSFRRKGHHFPLPVPTNVFHSYLRRWNSFAPVLVDQGEFLDWVDKRVIIYRHQIESVKVAGGKQGSVTGFIGSVEYRLSASTNSPQFEQLFYTLGQFAPYCGTGHKTTFGLGQTRLGWLNELPQVEGLVAEHLLGERIEQLTELLMQTQKRKGGTRGIRVSQVRATILARHEFGESLREIAIAIEMPYETVKTYAKLARRTLKVSK